MTKEELNELSKTVIGVAIEVHKRIGPGFAEKIYQRVLEIELKKRGLAVEREKKITIEWEEEEVGYHYLDFLVDKELVIEIKIVSGFNQLHQAQLLSYLKVLDKKLGLLLNFGEAVLRIKRVVNQF